MPAEIWEVTRTVAGEALVDAGVRAGELAAVGITNQRETVCVWDPTTGEPLHRAIVWQDRRTAARCDELREAGHEALVRERTGLVLDPYFSASKIEWLLEHVEGLRERALAGRALFGTVDSWLIYKLTGEHLTDVSNASRTMLTTSAPAAGTRICWSSSACRSARCRRYARARASSVAPRRRRCTGTRCPWRGSRAISRPRSSARRALIPGMGKNTYGTGSFVLLNCGHTTPAPARACWERWRGASAARALMRWRLRSS